MRDRVRACRCRASDRGAACRPPAPASKMPVEAHNGAFEHGRQFGGRSRGHVETVEILIVRAKPRGERALDRSARIGVAQLRNGHEHIGSTELVERIAPPGAAATSGLAVGQQQRIATGPRRADIIDAALPGLILGPGTLPGVALLIDHLRSCRDGDREQQHRRRTRRLARRAEIALRRAGGRTPRPAWRYSASGPSRSRSMTIAPRA